ncbi:MAG: 50S ribosomal protein L20 [Patescibacteria group bacterium]
MPRVKRGTISLKRRRNVLRKVKGYRFGRSKKESAAREAIAHAGSYAFAHRRDKKNDFRRIWQVNIGTALGNYGISYSKFMGQMKKKGIILNRKMMSELAQTHPETFTRIVSSIKN